MVDLSLDLADPNVWVALGTLTLLEVVLGIDNIVFISILSDKLHADQREKARKLGLSLAMLIRILLLLSLTWIMGLTATLFTVMDHAFTGKDIVLIAGGLFLLAKATHEIHGALEGTEGRASTKVHAALSSVIIQILLLDIVFSLDSVITAVGMTEMVLVMIAAVIMSVGVMLVASGPISAFVRGHPTIKMLALSFLILIGVTLMADGLGQHIPKGYVYFAMAFSLGVELLNLRLRRRASPPVELHPAYAAEPGAPPKA